MPVAGNISCDRKYLLSHEVLSMTGNISNDIEYFLLTKMKYLMWQYIFTVTGSIYSDKKFSNHKEYFSWKQAQNLCIAAQSWIKLNKVEQSWTKLNKVEQSWTKLNKVVQSLTKFNTV